VTVLVRFCCALPAVAAIWIQRIGAALFSQRRIRLRRMIDAAHRPPVHTPATIRATTPRPCSPVALVRLGSGSQHPSRTHSRVQQTAQLIAPPERKKPAASTSGEHGYSGARGLHPFRTTVVPAAYSASCAAALKSARDLAPRFVSRRESKKDSQRQRDVENRCHCEDQPGQRRRFVWTYKVSAVSRQHCSMSIPQHRP
jgi:hypothetical protein